MTPFETLSRRITIAFVLFGIVLSLFFAVLAAVAVEGIEEHLVDDRLADVEKWARPRHAAGLQADLPAGLRFHRGEDIPLSLRGLPAGVSDVEVDGVSMHALAGTDAHGPYVVVDHESDYEKVELVVYSMFGAFFLGFLLLAAFLGGFVGRRIVVPAINAHTAAIRAGLDRERYFTGDVSHELRTPLAVILGASEILLEHEDDPAIREPAQRIYRAAQEASARVAVLLLLARAPAPSAFAPVPVGPIARSEVERHQSLVANKPVTLHVEENAEFSVRAPQELCASAIANLIRNACLYTERGTVTVKIEPGCVIVEDSGPGLPAGVLQMLLSLDGVNTNGAASASGSGSGLGLSLVRRICEYIGATLDYAEREGGGSRFIMRFPADLTRP